jgi:hypothetical protein
MLTIKQIDYIEDLINTGIQNQEISEKYLWLKEKYDNYLKEN